MTTPLLPTALLWLGTGASIIPTKNDGSKRPFGPWTAYQTTAPGRAQLERWFANGEYSGLGVVCGAVSGELEMLEVEGRAIHQVGDLVEACEANGLGDLWDRIDGGCVEGTPSGGIHWHYRVSDGPAKPNTQLAKRPATAEELAADPTDEFKVLWETRGKGGFTVLAPSNGSTHSSGGSWVRWRGDPTRIPAITVAERDALHTVIAAFFDEMPPPPLWQPASATTAPADDGRLKPGTDYNTRGTWDELLGRHGWVRGKPTLNGSIGWTRPGKNPREGISATTREVGNGHYLYVFSTSTVFTASSPGDPHPYDLFGAYTLLEHGGNFGAATKALAAKGYGEKREQWADDYSDLYTAEPSSNGHKPPAGAEPEVKPEVEPTPEREPFDTLRDDFWNARPFLAAVRDFARSRRVSPWAMFGVCLARIDVCIPPHVVLPPTIGSYASLNIFVGLAGVPGAAKTSVQQAAEELLHTTGGVADDVLETGVGSGEGLIGAYVYNQRAADGNPARMFQHRISALFSVDEVGHLEAIAGRQGSTAVPTLLSAWSAAQMATENANPNLIRRLRKHTYRLAMVSGILPGKADFILDAADCGFPQRWLWMPTYDKGRLKPGETLRHPSAIRWKAPFDAPEHTEADGWTQPERKHALALPQVAVDAILAANEAANRPIGSPAPEGAELDGHSLLCRAKVAALLAFIDERDTEVTVDDWDLAGVVMEISDHTRQEIVDAQAKTAGEEGVKKAKWAGKMAAVSADASAEVATARCMKYVRNALTAHPGWHSANAVRKFAGHRYRDVVGDAMTRLVQAGELDSDQRTAANGKQAVYYRLVAS